MKRSDLKKYGSQQAKKMNRINWLIRIIICLVLAGGGFAACKGLGPVYETYKAEQAAAKQEEAQAAEGAAQKEDAEEPEQQAVSENVEPPVTGDTEEAADEAARPEEPVITEPPAVQEPVIQPVSMSSVSISATSALSEYDMTHSPDRVADGDLSTAWVEGKEGQGEGEALVFTFPENCLVSGFTIHAGYQKNEDIYYKNSRPAVIRLSYSDGRSEEYTLEDMIGEQSINLNETAVTNSVTFTIVSVYGGWKYEDTAISEIAFY